MLSHGETITVWLEISDRFGVVTVADERAVVGCAVFPQTSVESTGVGPGQGNQIGRLSVTSGITLLVPPGAGLTARHRVQLADGSLWEVSGEPGRWRSPLTGWAPGDQVELERSTG